ncbi:MAG: YlxR family protein [Prevotella sp.]|nr:YlxR family protein [Prevotella sp.]
MAATKKTPMRMCLGCGEMKPKKELIRAVKAPDGSISIDLTGKKSGRGAYICRSRECFAKARKSRRFEKAFSCRIADEVYDGMERELTEDEQSGKSG